MFNPTSLPISLALLACINTTYSASDEKEITNDLRLLVIGAFAHHGEAFYKHELNRCQALLVKNPRDFDARNDLGAALTKLGRFPEADTAFKENETAHPRRYRTAANRGVLYKKWGRFQEASELIAESLRIRPGGHMGLGDYYLRMIRWRAAIATTDSAVVQNFLGVKYAAGWKATAQVANREHLVTLIKNDMGFADAYIVLGDIMYAEQDFRTAVRCYLRARYLGHPTQVPAERYEMARNELASSAGLGAIIDSAEGPNSVLAEFKAAEIWLEDYQVLEAKRLEAGLAVDFGTMRVALTEAGVTPPKIIEQHTYSELWSANFILMTIVKVAMALILYLAIRYCVVGLYTNLRTSRNELTSP